MSKTKEFIPALRFGVLNFLYDPVVAMGCRERYFKSCLIKQSLVREGDKKILDLGAGTGTLAIQIKKENVYSRVVGLDADSDIISRAQQKAKSACVDTEFVEGMSCEMPFAECFFDTCVSSLFFHHLTTKNKERTLKEVYRVLKPGGELHIADWGEPTGPLMRSLFYLVQLVDGFSTTSDNVKGLLPSIIKEAGFADVSIKESINTALGTITLYRAIKPR